jgi:hypothetical protein
MGLAIDASNSSSSSSTGTSKRVSPCRVKTASNSTWTIACGTEDDGAEVADPCASPLSEDGLVTGLAVRIWSDGEKSLNAGYLALIKVTFLYPRSLVSSAGLPWFCMITTVVTEEDAATAKTATIAMVILTAIDIPTFPAVAAAAIVPAPVAVDVPADAAALTAIEWRVELKLSTRTLDGTIVCMLETSRSLVP